MTRASACRALAASASISPRGSCALLGLRRLQARLRRASRRRPPAETPCRANGCQRAIGTGAACATPPPAPTKASDGTVANQAEIDAANAARLAWMNTPVVVLNAAEIKAANEELEKWTNDNTF